ncbi:TRAP transporter small permease subunit [Variovorax sp. J31P179]|jgi:TRAP-type mannitol/chloroaromatic compound transport system permease small subunit|uniref:TRAP transporter small permease subunit n=1 Tax=Variovorax sp. J31P179 TaxID=3053508 RepID=UPI002576AE02|nr:TRAP transporter small permease subunit [Variovorax sp. J31P179]MDM0078977.1 TRAP transporter small permease subunit [Variovorax sp. J31P179]
MNSLLRASRLIDALNTAVGKASYWLILIAVLVSSGNAVVRKAFNMSSNSLLEIQWYLFAAVFLLCAGYTLLNKEHVRVDLIHSRLSRRQQLWVEIFGTLFFLAPVTLLILVLSWAPFVDAYTSGEVSSNAGGLIRWPVKLLIPVGFGLLLLQGASELIKDVAELRGLDRSAPTAA